MKRMARDNTVGFRVSDEELVALERAARKDRRTVSDFVRDTIMIDFMLIYDHTFMTEVRRQIRQSIEERTFQRTLPTIEYPEVRKKRA